MSRERYTTKDLGPDFEQLADALESMSLDELRHFCEATLKAATTGHLMFKARFPAAYETWNVAIETGNVSFQQESKR